MEVKLSQSADFEGIEDLAKWTSAGNTQIIPDVVLRQLESPDIVVVRVCGLTVYSISLS